MKNLFNGRKCIYNYQCYSKICDEDTNKCKGRLLGESCSDHAQCNNGLACRPSGIWPYKTQCLPLAEVGSECYSDYDCKTRNFCWKLKKSDKQSICLEMHSAPDQTQIMWDRVNYPKMTKESVFKHGRYCISGFAYQRKDNPDIAQCISIDTIRLSFNETQGF